ncbi:MAG: hypothetical protein ABMA64_27400 [Myxococcota bacterium]
MRRWLGLLAAGCGPASSVDSATDLFQALDLPGCAGQYDDPADEYAYVVSGRELVPVNPRSCTLGTPIALGSNPTTAAVTGSGRWIYVGDAQDHTLTVVSQERDEVDQVIPLPFAPDELMFEPAHTVLWVADRQTGAVVLVESAHHTVVGEASFAPGFSALGSTDAPPQTMVAAHPDGFVQVLDQELRVEIARIETGGPPLAVGHASNTADLYVCVGGDAPELWVVPSTGPLAFLTSTRVPLEAPCTGIRFNGYRYGAAIVPDRDVALVIDTEVDAVAAEVPVGSDPDVVVLNGTHAAIGNLGSGDVSVVALDGGAEIARTPIGGPSTPVARRLQDGLDPSFVYAFDPSGGTLSVIDLRDGAPRLPVEVGPLTAMVVAGPRGGKCH